MKGKKVDNMRSFNTSIPLILLILLCFCYTGFIPRVSAKGGDATLTTNEDYQALLTDLIKKQMVMLGPGVAISKARKVSALTITDGGDVTAVGGDGQAALKQLAGEYMALSGEIAQTTLTLLLEKYPEIKAQNI